MYLVLCRQHRILLQLKVIFCFLLNTGTHYDLQGDRKITDIGSLCQKINYIEIINKKQCYVKRWKCPPLSAMHTHTLFLKFDATR
jgi:hypothetical protein